MTRSIPGTLLLFVLTFGLTACPVEDSDNPDGGAAVCGDGVVNGTEACDDGSANSDTDPDACRTDCSLATCGDGALDSSEVCDDGAANSDTAPDACRTDCSLPTCGDGIIDSLETCDDGAANSDVAPDACRTDCSQPACGDAVVDSGEACDDGVDNSDTRADACRQSCALAACGDSTIDSGEECDEGASNSDIAANACRTSCRSPVCGDNVVDAGESCDDGPNNSDTLPGACRLNCAPATCGDGTLDSGEQCDLGAGNSDTLPDTCRTTCALPQCGDAVVDAGESCDDGTNNSDTQADACRTACVAPTCGDSVIDSGEACDDGANNSDSATDACRTSCDLPTCGDSVIDSGEACDDGPGNDDASPDACRTSCALPACGDSVIDSGETCDDGANNSNSTPDACRLDCAPSRCGDGVPDSNEECDDGSGNSNSTPDACRTTCDLAYCGDGTVDNGEACDDGSNNSDSVVDACRTSCDTASCGDGVIDTGEACDDGSNNSDTDVNACRTSCDIAFCGDGVIDTGEACDDGSNNSDTVPGACRTNCAAATCGDGTIDVGEQCDDGPANSDTAADACRLNCQDAVCGDGTIDTGETCDDGAANSDTAPGACRRSCVPAGCGDGVTDSGEECDDGATLPGDGCSATCFWEVPPTCLGTGHSLVNLYDVGTSDGGNGFTYSGSTVGGLSTETTACGGAGPEVFHGYFVPEIGDLIIEVTSTTSLDARVAMRTTCDAPTSEAGCEDIAGLVGEDRTLIIEDVHPSYGLVFIQVDGFGGTEGLYDLHVRVAPPLSLGETCRGDGTLGRCDPAGGTLTCADPDLDGTGTCAPIIALGGTCDPAGATSVCEALTWCNPASSTCELACGNNLLDPGEQCDDGGTTGGDGCNALCFVEGSDCSDPWDLNALGFDAASGEWTWAGDTGLHTADYEPSCDTNTGYAEGVARFVAPSTGIYGFALDPTFDAVIYLWDGVCGAAAPELACVSAPDLAARHETSALLTAGQEIFIVVDGDADFAGNEFGPFLLTVAQSVCGNSIIELGEQCDDGGTAPGDGCNALCLYEGGACIDAYDLNALGWDAATSSWIWSSDSSSFTADYDASCAPTGGRRDGVASFVAPTAGNYGIEITSGFDSVLFVWDALCGPTSTELACSDAGTTAGSPESALVALGAGQQIYVVVDGYGSTVSDVNSGPFNLQVSEVICGDNAVDPGEECDDGNTTPGDGCDATCLVETTPEIEVNDDATTATPMTPGTIYEGAIVPAGDLDYYSFTATTGTSYTFETHAGTYGACDTAAGESRDTRIRLYDQDGVTELAQDDDGGLSICSLLTWIAPADGTYYVRVQYYSESTFRTIDPYFLEFTTP